ncbi:hypothetical protein XPA_007648 [Xanthoria parietina]
MLLDQTTALSAAGPNPFPTPLPGSPGQIPVTDPFSVGSNPKDDSTIGDGPDSNDFLGNSLFRSGHSTGWADMMWNSDLMESGNMIGGNNVAGNNSVIGSDVMMGASTMRVSSTMMGGSTMTGGSDMIGSSDMMGSNRVTGANNLSWNNDPFSTSHDGNIMGIRNMLGANDLFSTFNNSTETIQSSDELPGLDRPNDQ